MFDWKEEYAIGIEAIDDQHQGWFKLGKKLEDLADNHQYEENFEKIIFAINDLLTYTSDHFKKEEAYMKSINYPDRTAHMTDHQKMVDYIASIDIGAIDETQHKTIGALVDFISGWIINHILIVDQKIVDYIVEAESSH